MLSRRYSTAEDTDPRTEVGRVGLAVNTMLDHVDEALTARQASEEKVRQFVADASHELRTPLASIRGYSELTRRSGEKLSEPMTHALSRIESEAVRMTALVEDLLLLARLDEGRELVHGEVDLTRVVIDCVADVDETEQFVDTFEAALFWNAVEPALHVEEFAAGLFRIECRILQCDSDVQTNVVGFADDAVARDDCVAIGRCKKSGEHPHGRALAGAVRAEKAVDLARLDTEVDRIDREILRLLGERLVELEIVESISPPTVMRALKKTPFSPTGANAG